jgi:hypothetical protein
LPQHTASPDGRKPPTQRITNRGLCLTQATMTMIKHNPMNDPPILGLHAFHPYFVVPPKNTKSFFPETRNPDFGTCCGRPYFVAPPKNTKSFFPETRNPDFGTTRISSLFCCTPQNHEKLFPEIRNPDFGTCRGRNGPKWRPWSHFCIFTFYKFRTMYGLAFMCRKKFRNLPSTARFCAKRFRHIDFWTFFLSIF